LAAPARRPLIEFRRRRFSIAQQLGLKDYTDAKVQAELKDADMIKATNEGVIENGKERMKPFKDELTPAEVKELVAYIRTFKT
jgi:hypothetical protein